MKIHEYQGKELLKKFGVPVPRGFVARSPEEAAALRKVVGHRMKLVTPGIRPAGASAGDQKRIMTPARAIAAGADYLVVGRPVMEAADPRAAAEAIQAEIAQALT